MSDVRAVSEPWNLVSPYHDLNIGEVVNYTTRDGCTKRVTVEAFDERSITVRVNESTAQIPLGHITPRTEPQPWHPVINVVELEGLKIIADATQSYMYGSRYSVTLLNLHKDARLYLGEAGESISPPGKHVFPIAGYGRNFADKWLTKVPYGWHLGIDCSLDLGDPLVAVTAGTVVAIRHYTPAPGEEEDYWGNNLGLLGDDGVLYCYMHWDELASGISVGARVETGDCIGTGGRTGFETKPYPSHLHFEMMVLKRPEKFFFAYELDPETLPTPNRMLQPEVEGHVIDPYPYMVEWSLSR
jgi:murein DD-endopeptidase MepM/ murein hydrolase activator NlpD